MRWLAASFSLALLAAVVWPVTWAAGRDSFPLSSYPMFSRRRASAELVAHYVVGHTADRKRRWVPAHLVAGGGEVLQTRAALDRAATRDKQGRRAFCDELAARIARAGALPDVVRLELVRGRHDALAYYARGELGPEKQLAACAVPGRGGRR